MQALISGRAGVALIVDDGRLCSIGLDDGAPVPRTPRDIRLLLGDARDFHIVESESVATAHERLTSARAGDDALQLALFLLDPALSGDTREEAAGALEEALADAEARGFVEGVLFSCPAPPSADRGGARRSAARAKAYGVMSLLAELEASGEAIERVWRAWEGLPPSLFRGEEERAHVRATLVRTGMFHAEVLTTMGKLDAAIAIYLRALQADPNNVVAATGLADVREEMTRRSEGQVVRLEAFGSARAGLASDVTVAAEDLARGRG